MKVCIARGDEHPLAMTEERFWQKVDRSSGPTACWPWRGTRRADGYGIVGWRGRGVKYQRAHRVAWELTHGPIAGDFWVLHDCPKGDNPACCNPAHLWLGDHDANMADMVAKGRHRDFRGEGHPKAKLTWKAVREIRSRHRPYKITARMLATEYGVSVHTVKNVLKGLLWKDGTGV